MSRTQYSISTKSAIQPRIDAIYRELGADAFAVAISNPGATGVELRAAFKDIKGRPSLDRSVALTKELASLVAQSRRARKNVPFDRAARAPVMLLNQLHSSREEALIAKVRAFFKISYLGGACSLDLSVAGEERWNVALTSDPAAVKMTAETYKDASDRYKGAWSRAAKTAINVNVVLPRAWMRRVYNRGLQIVGGLLTLDAQPLDCKEPGVEVFAAKWAEQGRGKTVKVQNGFIARSGSLSFHGATYRSALTGLRRKMELSESPDAASARAEKAVNAFCKRWAKADFLVSVDDARETGACEFGIKSWCLANELPYDLGRAHISDVIAAYRKAPLPEARLAILHAARASTAAQAA